MQGNQAEGLLVREQAFYDENREALLLRHPNRWLLVHGEELVGHFETLDKAVAKGVAMFGKEPFLVRRAGDRQIEFSAPALSLVLLWGCR